MAEFPNAYQLPFSDYDPHPDIPGAYNFTHAATGKKILASGPEAERMRGLIDRMPDTRTASNDDYGGVGALFTGDTAAPSAPKQATDAGAYGGVGQVFTGGQPSTTPAAPPPAPQAAPAESPPAQALPQRNILGAPGQAAAAPSSSGFEPSAYVRPVTTKAGFVPGSETIKTEGGVQDPETRKLMLESYADEAKAAAAAHEAQQTALTNQAIQLDTEQKLATAEAAKAEDAVARRTAMQQQADAEYSRVMALKQKDLESASGREVDQYRMYRGKPAAAIGAALAMGLGAFGSSITHGPNYAMEIINKQIDNDVQSQREEINRGVNAKTNDIARIKDKYNVDSATAEKILALDLSQKAQAMARRQAAMIGGQQAQIQLAALDQQFAAANLARMKDLQATIAGKVETTMDQKYRQGGTSYVVDPRLRATAEAAKQGKEIVANQYGIENEGSAPPKAAPAKQPGEVTPQLSRALAASDTALKALYELREKREKMTLGENTLQKIGRGGGDSDYDAAVEHAANALAGMEANGMAPDQKRVEKIEHGVNSVSKESSLAHIDSLIEMAKNRRQQILDVSSKTARVGMVGGGEGATE